LVEDENASLYFALSHQKPQRIGALQLCALRVEITVRRGDQAAAKPGCSPGSTGQRNAAVASSRSRQISTAVAGTW
jgi:hypothetical protein